MRFLIRFLLEMAVAGLLLFALWAYLPWFHGEAPANDFVAAELLLARFEQGEETGLWFQRDTVDVERVYLALEARLPYAFTMQVREVERGSTELSILLDNGMNQLEAASFAEAVVRSLALEGQSEEEKLRTLHDWLVIACAYDETLRSLPSLNGGSSSFTAVGALIDGRAVCMGYARAYQLLCEAAGLRCFLVISEEMNHAWNGVLLADGTLRFVDCTYDDPVPDRPGEASDEFLLLDAAALRRTHRWDEAFYTELSEFLLSGRENT